MSSVKERIFGAVTIMSEDEAWKVWELIQVTFRLANAEAVDPEDDEITALNAYHNGSPEYQPGISQEDLIRELGI